MSIGKVYLVGAGCGDADLITLRGLEKLRSCDCVIYDDLIAPELLATVPADAEKIYMGKRSGQHSAPQEAISLRIAEEAEKGRTVVRLKGGDPFVFGRGGEEVILLQERGIPYEVVPGISSSIAIPSAAGIPVTHRGLSHSFHVITAHTANTPDGLPEQFDTYARLDGTLIFLMGLGKLGSIARRLMAGGKPGNTPAAVLSGGNSPNPATVRGTLDTIEEKAREAGVKTPAVIVVGAVAGVDFSSTMARPLQGVQVGLTGTSAITEKLEPVLRSLGARTVRTEASLTEELDLPFPLIDLADGKPHWVVLTGANGTRLFFDMLRRQGVDLRRLSNCRFAVIGKSTGKVLHSFGIIPDLCPTLYTSTGLGESLVSAVKEDEDVYIFRSSQGSPELPAALERAGISFKGFPIYRLKADPEVSEAAKNALPNLDYLVFSSAGGVELFMQSHGSLPEQAKCVCIGSVTAAALKKYTSGSFILAPEIGADGIVNAILNDR